MSLALEGSIELHYFFCFTDGIVIDHRPPVNKVETATRPEINDVRACAVAVVGRIAPLQRRFRCVQRRAAALWLFK